MTKVFLKDFITRRRVIWSAVSVAMLALLLGILQTDRFSSGAAANVLGIMICFFPTMYVIYSYAVFEHIRSYLALPVSSHKTILSFAVALFVDTLIERMALVAVAVLFLFENPLPVLALLPVSGFATVLINVVILLGINRRNPLTCAAGGLLFAALTASCIFGQNLLFQLSRAALAGLICIPFILRHCSLDLSVMRSGVKSARVGRNYFFNVLLSEKMYLLNTVLVLVFAAVFLFLFVKTENPILGSFIWGIAAVNTPVGTMLSGDKALVRQADMLPGHHGSVMGMYRRFLIVYYLIVNVFVLALCVVHAGRIEPYMLIQFAVAAVAEIIGTLYLESKYRISGWQTKQQLWRSPRKYVVPAIVLALSCAIGLLTTLK